MKQTILTRFKEKFSYVRFAVGDDNFKPILSFLESELTLFEKDIREKTITEAFYEAAGVLSEIMEDINYNSATKSMYMDHLRQALEQLRTPQKGNK